MLNMDCLLYVAINSTQDKKKTNIYNQACLMWSGPIGEEFSRYIGPGPEEPERGPWISEGPNSLSHRRFILICFHFLGHVQLFLDMLSGHSAAQEIKHLWKFGSGFIEPEILNFERSLNLFSGPQSSLVPPCKIYLGSPACDLPMECRNNSNYRFD